MIPSKWYLIHASSIKSSYVFQIKLSSLYYMYINIENLELKHFLLTYPYCDVAVERLPKCVKTFSHTRGFSYCFHRMHMQINM